ncbi:MAG: L-serine ammonia-lyase, iron-sulfur-dependent, subunit alpha, partial [Clostridia bacterium]|nr:L-serine ammonia-lyase, iron-sulfur-dependent, subunit alpha [Clostridia bacterium]
MDCCKTELFEMYGKILAEELKAAQGCTEPIAIAYAGAVAREKLGEIPTRIVVRCSGNIIKNVKNVVVPNSGNMMGIGASATLGIIGGESSCHMQVLQNITQEQIELAKKLLNGGFCTVVHLDSDFNLHIILEAYGKSDSVSVEIRQFHDNIVRIVKNGHIIYDDNTCKTLSTAVTDRSVLNIEDIYAYANQVDIQSILPLIDKQIEYNYAIAVEGMNGQYGLGIGVSTVNHYPDWVFTRMRAYTTAASEARMCGCPLPVITNSGSGNQGISASVPLIVYAKEKDIGHEKLVRSLVFSNLVTIYQKTYIGRLSAFCGVISATCGAISGLAYMLDEPLTVIENVIINTLESDVGVVCDGAKASCASKIACGFECALNAFFLAVDNKKYGANT